MKSGCLYRWIFFCLGVGPMSWILCSLSWPRYPTIVANLSDSAPWISGFVLSDDLSYKSGFAYFSSAWETA